MKTCAYCREEKPLDLFYEHRKGSGTYRSFCKLCAIASVKVYHDQIRLDALRYYSDSSSPFCLCCYENDLTFLTIDHTNGGGGRHRTELGGGGHVIYRYLKKSNYPAGFRVLCYNCNNAFGKLGFCPHGRLATTKII